MSALPQFTLRQLLEAGIHFGHHRRRWNPKMGDYIFGAKNNIHIINLEKTVPLMREALGAIQKTVSKGGRILFVGTKRQAQEKIAESAKKCGQFYVNHRWLGGMLTNWQTISKSIKKLKTLTERLAVEDHGYTKKEFLNLCRLRDKLDLALGGIQDMGGVPDMIFVIDTNMEAIAIQEANKIGIPVVAVIDTNSTPEGIDYPIPGNDDAIRAIELYCDLVCESVLSGIQAELEASGIDFTDSLEDSEKVKLKRERSEQDKDAQHRKAKGKDAESEDKSSNKPHAKTAPKSKESKVVVEKKASKAKAVKTEDAAE